MWRSARRINETNGRIVGGGNALLGVQFLWERFVCDASLGVDVGDSHFFLMLVLYPGGANNYISDFCVFLCLL